MLDRERLADHPAHRDADHVGRLDPEVVHQPDGVLRHVGEQVGGPLAPAKEEVEASRNRGAVELGRVADVAVVEADDAEAAFGQHRAELLVPGQHLRRQTHHHQQRLAIGVADLLVGDLDAVGGRQALFAESALEHGRQVIERKLARMRTAVVSDLHLGSATGEDVARDPAIRRVLLDEIATAPTASSCSATCSSCASCRSPACWTPSGPSSRSSARRWPGAAVVLVPGNHDHRLAEPLLERARPGRRRRWTSSTVPCRPASRPTRIAAWLGEAELGVAYRASGCATTSTRPTATTWTAT